MMKFEYHEICKWLPYKEEVVAEIAEDMKEHGYREDRPISLFHGKILDGRHRYEAALRAGVEPFFQDYLGTTQGAIDYVTSENVKRRMLTNREKEFFYAQRADALGVQSRGGDRKSEINTPNGAMVPSQEEHADAIGVGQRTVNRWEKDRKEIKADPYLSEKAKTFEGFVEAKKELKERKLIVPKYNIQEAMGAIKGIASLYGKEWEGTDEEAASVLISELLKGCETDDVGMSIARDFVKWFLKMKKVLDIAEPELEQFLKEEPKLKIVK
jgi:transcriptional regulator with XRE-family HTH domain